MNLRQEQEDNEQISNRTIRTIQENRAKSTTLSYAKVQREFKAYCTKDSTMLAPKKLNLYYKITII